MNDYVRVECELLGQVAGNPPALDSLLEATLSRHYPKAIAGEKIDRQFPAPPLFGVPIPLVRGHINGHEVYRCSSPIFVGRFDRHEHITKKIDLSRSSMLRDDELLTINTTGGEFKSYRLPLRVRAMFKIVWFARGDRRELLNVLRRVTHVGNRSSHGWGLVKSWEVQRIDADHSWFAESTHGQVLMRPLPDGPHLPQKLRGYQRDFGACQPPYWHQDRFMEIVSPC